MMRRLYLPALALGVITLIAYAPVILHGGFIWDDDSYVTGNDLLTAPDGLSRIWLHPRDSPQFYPLVFTTFRIEHALWGFNPRGYHVMNVILHALSAAVLWRVLLRLGLRGAWLAAAVFAVHPMQVESVAWITERKNTLSALFWLLSLAAYLRFAGIGISNRRGDGVIHWYVTALVLFVCALLSKTVACTLPVVILVLLWWKGGSNLIKHAAMLVPFLLIGMATGLTTAFLEVSHVGAVGAEWDLSVLERCLVAGRVACFYVGKLVWPAGLAFVYARWAIDAADPAQWLWPLAMIALAILLWSLRNRIGRGPFSALAIYVVVLSPALGFVNVFPMRYSFVADHFQYLASVPVIVMIVSGLAGLVSGAPRRAIPAGVAAAVIILALSVRTWHQCQWYQGLEHLWRATIRSEPDAAMPHYNLAKLLAARGTPEALDEAAQHFRETLRVKPDAVDVHENLGLTLGKLGRYDEATEQLELAIVTNPDDASAHGNLATAYRLSGRHDDAVHHYTLAVNGDPDHAGHYLRLADLLVELDRVPDAIRTVRLGIERNPDSAPLCNSLAAFLCRSRDPALRDGPSAVEYAAHACALTGRRNPSYLQTLADALAEAGRPVEAAAVAREAKSIK